MNKYLSSVERVYIEGALTMVPPPLLPPRNPGEIPDIAGANDSRILCERASLISAMRISEISLIAK